MGSALYCWQSHSIDFSRRFFLSHPMACFSTSAATLRNRLHESIVIDAGTRKTISLLKNPDSKRYGDFHSE